MIHPEHIIVRDSSVAVRPDNQPTVKCPDGDGYLVLVLAFAVITGFLIRRFVKRF